MTKETAWPAFNEGLEAHVQGKAAADCPYAADSAEAVAWTAGWHEADGLDEGELNNRYRGVDLCLRVKESGRLIVWTPHAVLLHEALTHEAAQIPETVPPEAPDDEASHAL